MSTLPSDPSFAPMPFPDLTAERMSDHAAHLRRLARHLLRDPHAAEDALQETWLRFLRRPPARSENLGGWLASVLRSKVAQGQRGESRRQHREAAAARPEATPGPGGGGDRVELLQALTAAVVNLEEPYRDAVMLRFFEDLPPREIARRQGVPVTTVKSRLQRGLDRIRTRLAQGQGERWRERLGALLSVGLGEWAGGAAAAGATPWFGGLLASIPAKLGVAALVALVLGLTYSEGRRHEGAPELPGTVAAAPILAEAIEVPAGPTVQREELASEGAPDALERTAPAPVRGAFELEGRCLDGVGLPLSGATIYAAAPGLGFNRLGKTNDLGEFSFRLEGRGSSADLHLTAFHRAHGPGPLATVKLQARRPVELELHLAGQQPTLEIHRGPEGVQAVYNEARQTGMRVGYLLTRSFSPPAALATAPQALTLPDGTLRLLGSDPPVRCPSMDSIRVGEYLSTFSASVGVVEQPILFDVALGTELVDLGTGEDFVTARVEGQVHTAAGQPARNVSLALLDPVGSVKSTCRADAEGRYAFELEPGNYVIRAGGGAFGLAQAPVALVADQVTDFSPQLDRGLEVKGTLALPASLRGKEVQLELVDLAGDLTAGPRLTLAADGSFSFPNVGPGEKALWLHLPGESAGLFHGVLDGILAGSDIGTLELPEEALPRAELRLSLERLSEHSPSEVRLRQLDTGRMIWLKGSSGAEQAPTRILDLQGVDLPAGPYVLEVGSKGQGWRVERGVLLLDGAQLDLGTLDLHPLARIEMLDPAPVPGDVKAEERWPELALVAERPDFTVESLLPPGDPQGWRDLFLEAGGYRLQEREDPSRALEFQVDGGPGFLHRRGAEAPLEFLPGAPGPARERAELPPVSSEAQACRSCHTSGG